ncbi:hypothetical protein DFJ63DRAFT_310112 [Scheffersomyces coipomensis]|uniref:uncharacterized protein n=1 Tax=Scheffersomyces coipomensis TaxID=1788519 RepID=UPI00315D17F9
MKFSTVITSIAALSLVSAAAVPPSKVEATVEKRETLGELIQFIEDVVLHKSISTSTPSGVPSNPGLSDVIPQDLLDVQLGDIASLGLAALPTSIPSLLNEVGSIF